MNWSQQNAEESNQFRHCILLFKFCLLSMSRTHSIHHPRDLALFGLCAFEVFANIGVIPQLLWDAQCAGNSQVLGHIFGDCQFHLLDAKTCSRIWNSNGQLTKVKFHHAEHKWTVKLFSLHLHIQYAVGHFIWMIAIYYWICVICLKIGSTYVKNFIEFRAKSV